MKYTQEKYHKDCEKAKQQFQDACVSDASIYFNKLNELVAKRQKAILEELE